MLGSDLVVAWVLQHVAVCDSWVSIHVYLRQWFGVLVC